MFETFLGVFQQKKAVTIECFFVENETIEEVSFPETFLFFHISLDSF